MKTFIEFLLLFEVEKVKPPSCQDKTLLTDGTRLSCFLSKSMEAVFTIIFFNFVLKKLFNLVYSSEISQQSPMQTLTKFNPSYVLGSAQVS